MGEKEFIPPVPTIPKHPHDPHTKSEKGYGYNGAPNQNQYSEPKPYPAQPPIEAPIHEEQGDHLHPSESNDSTAPLNYGNDEFVSKSSILPSRPSRSVARMAVAESAAANAFVDPIHRYQPKKPSPLALKAAEEKKLRSQGEPLRPLDTNMQETLTGPNDRLIPNEDDHAARKLSGEWGVALGSPNHDGSFAAQQYGSSSGPTRTSYSNEPYLAAAAQNRAPSGQYTTDPYSIYHDGGQQVDSAAKQGNWV